MNWQDVCAKWDEDGFYGLEEAEQIWVSVRGFIDAVNGGGLVSYFYNSLADHYDDAVYALGELEAFEALDILESFANFFGDDVPADIEERNHIINSWDKESDATKAVESVDKVLYSLFDPLELKLKIYLIENGYDLKLPIKWDKMA